MGNSSNKQNRERQRLLEEQFEKVAAERRQRKRTEAKLKAELAAAKAAQQEQDEKDKIKLALEAEAELRKFAAAYDSESQDVVFSETGSPSDSGISSANDSRCASSSSSEELRILRQMVTVVLDDRYLIQRVANLLLEVSNNQQSLSYDVSRTMKHSEEQQAGQATLLKTVKLIEREVF